MNVFVLLNYGVVTTWLIVCLLAAMEAGINDTWPKLGLRKTYYQLVAPFADDDFADQPQDLKPRCQVLDSLCVRVLKLEMVAGLALTTLLMFATAFRIAGGNLVNSQISLVGTYVVIGFAYALNGVSILLMLYWQSLNLRAGKRLQTMRELIKLINEINKQVAFSDYQSSLRMMLLKVVALPKASFQWFWRQFQAQGQLAARLTVLRQVLQPADAGQLLHENPALAREATKTVQLLLDTMTDYLDRTNKMQHQQAEQNRRQRSQRLLNEFRTVTGSRK